MVQPKYFSDSELLEAETRVALDALKHLGAEKATYECTNCYHDFCLPLGMLYNSVCNCPNCHQSFYDYGAVRIA